MERVVPCAIDVRIRAAGNLRQRSPMGEFVDIRDCILIIFAIGTHTHFVRILEHSQIDVASTLSTYKRLCDIGNVDKLNMAR